MKWRSKRSTNLHLEEIMKYMVAWTVSPENFAPAMARFKQEDPKPPASVKTLGRWVGVAGMEGFSLYETDDAAALWKLSSKWADLIDVQVIPVLTDEEVAKAAA
jgi:hypothetical protein